MLVLVTAHDVEVVLLGEVLIVLYVCLESSVILLFPVPSVAAIVETGKRCRRLVGVLLTLGVFASQIQVQAQVLKAVDLIVKLQVAQQRVVVAREVILVDLLHRVGRSVAVLHIPEGWVLVVIAPIYPLEVSAEVGVSAVGAGDVARRIHRGGTADSAGVARLVVGISVLRVDIDVQVIVKQRWVQRKSCGEAVVA